MALVVGTNAVAALNTGTYGTPVWNSLDKCVTNVSIELGAETADISVRGVAYKLETVTLKTLKVSFSMVWDSANTDVTAILTKYTGGTLADMLFLDGPVATVGSQGIRVSGQITSFKRSEDINGVLMVDCEIVPGDLTNTPVAWYTSS